MRGSVSNYAGFPVRCFVMLRGTFSVLTVLLLMVTGVCLVSQAAIAQGTYAPLKETINPEVLEEAGARIGQITFQTDNVFDPANPAEDKWL